MKKLALPLAVLAITAAHAQTPAVNWSGDLRYRHETIDDGSKIGHKNTQHRMRARLQAKSEISEDLTATARLATGGSSVTSTNQDLGDGGSNKDISIDVFSVDWKFYPNSTLTLGKMKNPIYTVGSSDMVFDGDVTPEGLSVGYKTDMFFASLSQFWIDNESTKSDVILYAPQAGVNLNAGPLKVTAGAAWYNFSSIQGTSTSGNDSIEAKGNSTTANTYTFGYKVLNAFVNVGGNAGDLGYNVYFDYIKNSEADTKDTGWLAGTKLSWKKFSLTYDYRWSENDATVGFLADGDTAGSVNVGLYGHRTKLGYKLGKNVSTEAVYYAHTIMSTKKHYDKYQLNVVFKF